MKQLTMVMLFLLIASMSVTAQSESRKSFKEGYESGFEEYSSLMLAIVSYDDDVIVLTISYKIKFDDTAKQMWEDNHDILDENTIKIMKTLMKVSYMKVVRVSSYGEVETYINTI